MAELSRAAAADIEAIFEHSITAFGLAQAHRYFKSLQDCLDLLDGNPLLGVVAEPVSTVYRRFPHQSHMIYYRITDPGVFVVRVLHRRMDPILHLADQSVS